MFELAGYPYKFVQCRKIDDSTAHLKTFVYKFRSDRNKLIYIVLVDEHQGDFFAIKFYPKSIRGSDRKFSKIMNRGDVSRILNTCMDIMIDEILESRPTANFGFIANRSFDPISQTVEGPVENQRYKVYAALIGRFIGERTFQHFPFPSISGYLLVNRYNSNVTQKRMELIEMLARTYPQLPAVS